MSVDTQPDTLLFPLPLEEKKRLQLLCQEPWEDILYIRDSTSRRTGEYARIPNPSCVQIKSSECTNIYYSFSEDYNGIPYCDISRICYLSNNDIQNLKQNDDFFPDLMVSMGGSIDRFGRKIDKFNQKFLETPKTAFRLLHKDTISTFESTTDETILRELGVDVEKFKGVPFHLRTDFKEIFLIDTGILFENIFGRLLFYIGYAVSHISILRDNYIDILLDEDFVSISVI
ncbi:hypothetical protein [Elstera sp.]|jgi:hypothetical protein|uniref:hypothetical protein n=1 Tax=Elstera sp. TaxID=1916664 RepID=UPI0037C0B2DB